jgi:BlaI family penicillinase repressor
MTPRRPTEAELELLQTLWDRGPSTVREIYNHLEGKRGYTTVLKHFQIMLDKGLVDRELDGQSHRYRARASEQDTQRGIVRHLVDGAFRKSSHALVMHALDERQTTTEELKEIRSLIDKLENERNNES